MTDEPTPPTEADLLRAHATVAARAADMSEQLETAVAQLADALHIQQVTDQQLTDAHREQEAVRENIERDRAIAQVRDARLWQLSTWLCDLAGTTPVEHTGRDQERAAYEKAKAELRQLRERSQSTRTFGASNDMSGPVEAVREGVRNLYSYLPTERGDTAAEHAWNTFDSALTALAEQLDQARRIARWFRHQGTQDPAVDVLTEQRGPLPDWLEQQWTGW